MNPETKTPFWYVARPIDQVKPGDEYPEWKRWLGELMDWTATKPMFLYRPLGAWAVGPGATPDPRLRMVNDTALDAADAMVAFLPAGVDTYGVPAEIERASAAGKPVLVVTDQHPSWSLPTSVVVVRSAEQMLAAAEVMLDVSSREAKPAPAPHTRELKVKLRNGARLPTRAHPDDAGLDLATNEDVVIPAGGFADVPTGVHIEPPAGTWVLLTGRSSSLRSWGLRVETGIIDAGYRGELFCAVTNTLTHDVYVPAGTRLAQIIAQGNVTETLEVLEVEELNGHARGTQGFGSSGK